MTTFDHSHHLLTANQSPVPETPQYLSRMRPMLAEVRQGIVGFGFFRSQNDSKRHACNDGMRKPRCSVDQPS